MSRKKFIEQHGATCNNWTWSWSFVNHEKKVVIFGAWDRYTDGTASLILIESWQIARGRKQPAYTQSREHIRLVEEEGYELNTFPIIYSDANKNEHGIGPAKIEGFIPTLTKVHLKKVGEKWYASDETLSNLIPEEIDDPENYIEGASKKVSVNTYERSAEAREKCISHHGCFCAVCDFDFEKTYGSIGKEYIHVHHLIPLSEIRKEYELNPIRDLIPVCANCHAIIHRTRPALSVEQLKNHFIAQKKQHITSR